MCLQCLVQCLAHNKSIVDGSVLVLPTGCVPWEHLCIFSTGLGIKKLVGSSIIMNDWMKEQVNDTDSSFLHFFGSYLDSITCSRGKPARTLGLHSSAMKMTSRSCTSTQLSRSPTRKSCPWSLSACMTVERKVEDLGAYPEDHLKSRWFGRRSSRSLETCLRIWATGWLCEHI